VNQDYQFWTSLMFWQQNLLGDGAAAGGARDRIDRSRGLLIWQPGRSRRRWGSSECWFSRRNELTLRQDADAGLALGRFSIIFLVLPRIVLLGLSLQRLRLDRPLSEEPLCSLTP
jgi:hypothetical protein